MNDLATLATEVTRAAAESSAAIEQCVCEQLMADIRREVNADDQAFYIAALMRKVGAVALHHWARTYCTEYADQMEHLGRDLRELRIADEIEFAKTMSTPSGRRAVAEGRD